MKRLDENAAGAQPGAAQTFDFSRFNSKSDNNPKPDRRTWRGVCELLEDWRMPRAENAKDGPAFGGASYPDGATRGNANVSEIALAILDFDNGTPLDAIEAHAAQLNRGAGAAAFIYSTWSHTPEAPKFRVVLPLSAPVAARDWPDVWQRLALAFDGAPDRAAKDAARLHFLPACPQSRAGDAVAVELDGAPLDVATLPQLPQPAPEAQRPAPNIGAASGDRYALKALENETGRVFMAPKGDRNNALNRAALALGHFTGAGRLSRSEVEPALLRAASAAGLKADEARATVKSGLDAGEREPTLIGLSPQPPAPNAARDASAMPERQRDAPDVAASARPRFPRLKLREIFERPRLEYLIDGIFIERGTGVLTNDYGGYKSFLALGMGLSVATGKAWAGRAVKRGAVVYVTPEGAYTLKDRVQAWLIRHGLSELPENFEVIEMPVQIGTAGDCLALLDELRELDPALVILDTVAKCNVGSDENDATAMGRFTHGMELLSRELGAFVLAIHHNNKEGKARGSNSLPANVDASIVVKKSPDRVVSVECDRVKGAPFETFALVGRVVELPDADEHGRPLTSLVFEPTDAPTPALPVTDSTRDKVLAVLQAAPDGLTATQWQRATELSSSRFYDYREQLQTAGKVTQNGRIYKVTPITPITPIRSESEHKKHSDYSDDALASEQSECFAGDYSDSELDGDLI